MATMTTTTATAAPKRDLDAIIAWLDAGLTLSTYDSAGRERRYTHGSITRERAPNGSVRTTHLTESLNGYVWLTRAGQKMLAERVRRDWHRVGEMQAARAARYCAALDATRVEDTRV
jgi:hypothetical protein